MEDIRGIADISGFGKKTFYEKACQEMLQAGWEWLNKNKNAKLRAHTYENVYGIFEPESKQAKELSKVITDKVDDSTGAMHQAVMQHLFYINKCGIEKWKEEVKKND